MLLPARLEAQDHYQREFSSQRAHCMCLFKKAFNQTQLEHLWVTVMVCLNIDFVSHYSNLYRFFFSSFFPQLTVISWPPFLPICYPVGCTFILIAALYTILAVTEASGLTVFPVTGHLGSVWRPRCSLRDCVALGLKTRTFDLRCAKSHTVPYPWARCYTWIALVKSQAVCTGRTLNIKIEHNKLKLL